MLDTNNNRMPNKSPLTEIQPSSTTREELFIVLEYLKEYAYDEKHLAKQTEIVKFAKDKYNYIFRRDRIPQILIHLTQISDRLPFKVKAKKINTNYRFFVERSFFFDNEIIDIIESLRNDQNKSEGRIKRLESIMLDTFVGKEKQKVLKEKIGRTISRGKHLDDYEQHKIQILKEAAYRKLFISYKLKTQEFEISNNRTAISRAIRNNETLDGYVYAFLSFDKGPHVAIYSQYHKLVLVTSIENIELTSKPLNVESWNKKVKFEINHSSLKTAGEWIDKHYKGKTLENFEILIAIKKGQEKIIKKSFETYYDTKMVPITTQVIKVVDVRGVAKTFHRNDNYIYTKLKTNIPSLENWFISDKRIMQNVVIVEPELFPFELVTSMLKNRSDFGLDNEKVLDILKSEKLR